MMAQEDQMTGRRVRKICKQLDCQESGSVGRNEAHFCQQRTGSFWPTHGRRSRRLLARFVILAFAVLLFAPQAVFSMDLDSCKKLRNRFSMHFHETKSVGENIRLRQEDHLPGKPWAVFGYGPSENEIKIAPLTDEVIDCLAGDLLGAVDGDFYDAFEGATTLSPISTAAMSAAAPTPGIVGAQALDVAGPT
jgi:hypothetical protein